MKHRWLALSGLVLLTIFTLLFPALPARAASLDGIGIEADTVELSLHEDGGADILETIEFQVYSDKHELDFKIDYAETGGITFQSISIGSTTENTGGPMFFEATREGQSIKQAGPATYDLTDNGKQLQIRLFTSLASDTKRVVRLAYRMDGMVIRQRDVALLGGHFFTSAMERTVGQPSLLVRLPSPLLSTMQIWSLPVSLAEFSTSYPQADEIIFQADHLTTGQDLTLIALLPLEIFPEAPFAEHPKDWDTLAASARSLQNSLAGKAVSLAHAHSLIFIMIGLAFVLLAMIYFYFDREGAADFRQREWLEMPPRIKPAVLARLMRRKKVSRLILSTLIDLVNQGHMARHGMAFECLNPEWLRHEKMEGFASYESELLHWLFRDVAHGQVVSITEVQQVARNPKTSFRFRAFSRRFLEQLDREVAQNNLIDWPRSRRGRTMGLLSALAYLLMSICGILILRTFDSLLLLLPAVVLAVYSLQIQRLTPAGREIHAMGRALYRTMSRAASPETNLDEQSCRNLLPLAIGMGLEKRLLQRMAAEMAKTGNEVDAMADYKTLESMLSACQILADGGGLHG